MTIGDAWRAQAERRVRERGELIRLLTRFGAALMLRMDDAAGVVVVTDALTQPQIYHRMLDAEFAGELSVLAGAAAAAEQIRRDSLSTTAPRQRLPTQAVADAASTPT